MTENILINIKFEKTVQIILFLFGLFILFQLLRKISGGSWSTEDIMLALLIFNLGAVFTIGMVVVQLRSDLDHLNNQFRSLANDFKNKPKKN